MITRSPTTMATMTRTAWMASRNTVDIGNASGSRNATNVNAKKNEQPAEKAQKSRLARRKQIICRHLAEDDEAVHRDKIWSDQERLHGCGKDHEHHEQEA